MKQVLSALFIFSLLACNSNKQKVYTPNLKDTSWVTVLYKIDVNKGLYDIGPAQKTYFESLKPDPNDSTRNVKTIDSAYALALFFQQRDTIRKDTVIYAIPKVDSNGLAVKKFIGLRPMKNEWVVKDFGKVF